MARRLVFALLIAAAGALAIAFLSSAPTPEKRAPAPERAAAQPILPVCPEQLPQGTLRLACRCTAEAMATGGVWGSEVYTDDSAICRAALHAGVTGVNGGPIEVTEAAGRASYPGDIRNSVSSLAWESWPRSITFRATEAEVDGSR